MTENMETIGNQAEGNTKTSAISKKRIVPSKRWCFTLNNWKECSLKAIVDFCNIENCKYVIGKEIGEQGTPHLQGYIRSENKFRPLEKKLPKEIHWEKAKGSEEENIIYCTKDDDYISKGLYIPKPLDIITKLYKWQEEVVELIKTQPNNRTINWFWEETGRVGKTQLCKYLIYHHGAVIIEGKKNDILYCAALFESNIYIIDLERSMEQYVSYGAIEKIKNGCYMCAKYESKPILRNSPHIIIFANFPPERDKLSEDRWNIIEIKPNE